MREPLSVLLASLIGLIALAAVVQSTVGDELAERQDGLELVHLDNKRRSVIANFPGAELELQQIVTQFLAPAVQMERSGVVNMSGTSVSLSTSSGADIRYTLDGSVPNGRSPLYTNQIKIDSTTVVRARSFQRGKFPSDTVTRTFFVGTSHELPIVAISTDPHNLWNSYSGIYKKFDMRGEMWRRKAVIEHLTPGLDSVSTSVGDIRIHGYYSRVFPKKSFHLYINRDVASGPTKSKILTSPGVNTRREVILRAGGQAPNVRVNDVLLQETFRDMGHVTGVIEPVALYINGAYFGAYNLREQVNADYAHHHFGIDEADVIQISSCRLIRSVHFYSCHNVIDGDDSDWLSLMNFVNENNLVDPANFKRVEDRIDINDFIDYWALNIFAANSDWPRGNIYVVRDRQGPDSRRRWVAWDADLAFTRWNVSNEDFNTLDRVTQLHDPPSGPWISEDGRPVTDLHASNWGGTLIFSKLLENEEFRRTFIQRYSDLLNTTFRSFEMEKRLNEVVASYSSEIDRDLARWDKSPGFLDQRVDVVRSFIEERPSYAWQHLQEKFELPNRVEVTIESDPSEGGSIGLNESSIITSSFEAVYFPGSTVRLEAMPADGFEFTNWVTSHLGLANETSRSIEIDIAEAITVRAAFRKIAN